MKDSGSVTLREVKFTSDLETHHSQLPGRSISKVTSSSPRVPMLLILRRKDAVPFCATTSYSFMVESESAWYRVVTDSSSVSSIACWSGSRVNRMV